MTKCCVCDADTGDRVWITQTNIGPLCKACFGDYCSDRTAFLNSLKELKKKKLPKHPSPEVMSRKFTI